MTRKYFKKLFWVALCYVLFKLFIWAADYLLSPLINIVPMGLLVFLLYFIPATIVFLIVYRRRVENQQARIEYRRYRGEDGTVSSEGEWNYIMNVHEMKIDLLAFATLAIYYIPFVYLYGIEYLYIWMLIEAVISFAIFWLILAVADFGMWLLIHRKWRKYL